MAVMLVALAGIWLGGVDESHAQSSCDRAGVSSVECSEDSIKDNSDSNDDKDDDSERDSMGGGSDIESKIPSSGISLPFP